MPTVFTRIIEGELPGRFVWRDEEAVAFLTIAPTRRGHTLVVPRAEIDHWIDAPPELLAHLTEVSRIVGRAIHQVYGPTRIGTMIAGFEVPHLHIHVLPTDSMADFDLARAQHDIAPELLDEDRERIAGALRAAGYEQAG